MGRIRSTYGAIQKCIKSRCEDNIKMNLREVGCDPGDWIDLAEDMGQWRVYVRAVMNLRVP